MTNWYYADDKQQRQGPLPSEALAQLYRSRQITADTLVWREGLAQWQALADFTGELGLADPANPPPLVPAGADLSATAPQAQALPEPRPALSTPAATSDAGAVVYAGFWRRYLALFIDQFILLVPVLALTVLLGVMFGFFRQPETATEGLFEAVYFLVYLVCAPLYYALQESSRHQATLGKRALGIKVSDLAGNRLGFAQALGRWFAASLSYLTLYIGFVMAAFTDRKQALHDIVAKTLVTDRWAFTEHPEQQKHGLSGCLVAVLVVLVAGVPVLAILAAIALPAYHDYTIKAKIVQAIGQATPLERTVADLKARNGKCPTNGEGTIKAAEAYATQQISAIDIGAMEESGGCAIQLTLRQISDNDVDGKRIWLEQDVSGGKWVCSSEVDDRYLPASCKG